MTVLFGWGDGSRPVYLLRSFWFLAGPRRLLLFAHLKRWLSLKGRAKRGGVVGAVK